MDLQDYLRLLRKNVWLVVATSLVGLGVAAAYSLTRVPQFQATSTVFVSTQTGDTAQELNQGSNFTQARVKSYVNLVSTPIVLDPVISSLRLPLTEDQLDARLTATSPAGTTLIQISVQDADPATAASISNGIASSLTAEVQQIETPTGQTISPVKLSLVRPAPVPIAAVSPRLELNLGIGLLIGLAVGLAVAVLRRLLDTRIRGERDVQLITGSPVISSIAFDRKAAERPLIVHMDPRSPRAEAFRTLRTNLQFLDVEGSHSFLVSSSVPSEGKSTTAVNLAIALADAGARVIVVDADLRRSKVSDYMGVEGGAGLTDVLIGRAELADVVQHWGSEELHVLPAGKVPPNPSELLGSKVMSALIDRLEKEYDVVIFDAPPLLPVTDAAVLSKRVGGVIMVVATGRTSRHQLAAALAALEHVGAHVAGLVLSMVPVKGPDSYGYGHGGYGYGPETVPAGSRRSRRRAAAVAAAPDEVAPDTPTAMDPLGDRPAPQSAAH